MSFAGFSELSATLTIRSDSEAKGRTHDEVGFFSTNEDDMSAFPATISTTSLMSEAALAALAARIPATATSKLPPARPRPDAAEPAIDTPLAILPKSPLFFLALTMP